MHNSSLILICNNRFAVCMCVLPADIANASGRSDFVTVATAQIV
jgi:hypothetical protein